VLAAIWAVEWDCTVSVTSAFTSATITGPTSAISAAEAPAPRVSRKNMKTRFFLGLFPGAPAFSFPRIASLRTIMKLSSHQ
jgi:hypothetical protein